MRDRLIELIEKEIDTKESGINTEWLADYLLANGAIVPPLKIGNKVYIVGKHTEQILAEQIVEIMTNEYGLYLGLSNHLVVSVEQQLGKTVFLSVDEAERALEGGVE